MAKTRSFCEHWRVKIQHRDKMQTSLLRCQSIQTAMGTEKNKLMFQQCLTANLHLHSWRGHIHCHKYAGTSETRTYTHIPITFSKAWWLTSIFNVFMHRYAQLHVLKARQIYVQKDKNHQSLNVYMSWGSDFPKILIAYLLNCHSTYKTAPDAGSIICNRGSFLSFLS